MYDISAGNLNLRVISSKSAPCDQFSRSRLRPFSTSPCVTYVGCGLNRIEKGSRHWLVHSLQQWEVYCIVAPLLCVLRNCRKNFWATSPHAIRFLNDEIYKRRYTCSTYICRLFVQSQPKFTPLFLSGVYLLEAVFYVLQFAAWPVRTTMQTDILWWAENGFYMYVCRYYRAKDSYEGKKQTQRCRSVNMRESGEASSNASRSGQQ